MIKGKRVNRGGGYGLKVPCEYLFEGDSFSCGFLKGLLYSPNKTTLNTDSSFYVYVMFDELLKDTEHGSFISMSKYPKISQCN